MNIRFFNNSSVPIYQDVRCLDFSNTCSQIPMAKRNKLFVNFVFRRTYLCIKFCSFFMRAINN